MSTGAIVGIILIAIIADSVIGALVLLSCWETEINLYSPIALHNTTTMNWFGCIFIYVGMHLFFPFVYLGLDLNLLFHIKRR